MNPSSPVSLFSNPSLLKGALHWAILGLLAVLPLFEFPKNLFWIGALLLWLLIVWKDQAPPPLPTGASLVFCCLLAATIIAALYAPFKGKEWRGVWDTLRYLSMFFFVHKISQRGQREAILFAIVFGTTVALVHGTIASADPQANLQLKSVGHTNHSAIYLLLAFGITLAVALGGITTKWRIIAGAIALLFFEGILRTTSRGTVGVALILPLLMGFSLDGFRSRRFFLSVGVSMFLGIYTIATNQPVVSEAVRLHETHRQLSDRDNLGRVSLEIFREYPFVGLGPNNFAAANETRLRQWLNKRGEAYRPEAYYYSSHAHSLYFNTLAERGIVGLVTLLALLGWLLFWLIRMRPEQGADGEAVVVWCAAVAAWCITVLMGTINTTLHHEHGMLTMALLGLAISSHTTVARVSSPAPPCNQA